MCVLHIFRTMFLSRIMVSPVCSALSSLVKSLFMPLYLEITTGNGNIKEKTLKYNDDLANNPMDLLITFKFLNNYSIVYLKINIFKCINFFSVPVSELTFSIFPRTISMVSSNWLVPKANLTVSSYNYVFLHTYLF